MKSRKTMTAILVASALGLAGAAIAETQDVEGGTSHERTGAERTVGSRQRRGESNQSTDVERQSARQQRSGVGSAGDSEPRARRSDSSRHATDSTAGSSGSRRDDRRADRSRFADRGERRQSSRQAGFREGGESRGVGRRDSWRESGDRRTAARTDRRSGDAGRFTRSDRRGLDKSTNRSHDRTQRVGYQGRSDRSRDTAGRARQGGFENRIDRRLSKQRERIREGRHSGELTRGELKRVRKDRQKIARMDSRFGSDGRYTKRERSRLNKALDRAGDRVYRMKNNDRVARGPGTQKRR